MCCFARRRLNHRAFMNQHKHLVACRSPLCYARKATANWYLHRVRRRLKNRARSTAANRKKTNKTITRCKTKQKIDANLEQRGCVTPAAEFLRNGYCVDAKCRSVGVVAVHRCVGQLRALAAGAANQTNHLRLGLSLTLGVRATSAV